MKKASMRNYFGFRIPFTQFFGTKSLIFLSAFLSSNFTSSAQANFPLLAPELPNLVEKILPGVVNISSTTIVTYNVYGMDDFLRLWGMPQEHKQSSLGSGFLIDAQGTIVTNNHVVDRADEVIVTLVDKRQFRAKIIGKDQKLDLAVLRITDKGKVPSNLSPVSFGNSEIVRIAEPVFAVGNPFGLQHTVTMGIISAKNRTIGVGPFDNFLQTDASINPGNSGGPLFNLKGEVIGINTVIFSKTGQSGGLGFAIPANEAKKILPDLEKYGRVPRPWLGLLGQGINSQMEAFYNLPVSKGIIVLNLVDSAPAERAGIRQGDIITDVESQPVSDNNELERALAVKKPKDQVNLSLRRGRKKIDLKIKLDELPRLEQLPQGIL